MICLLMSIYIYIHMALMRVMELSDEVFFKSPTVIASS
jgi:hypothetical protein